MEMAINRDQSDRAIGLIASEPIEWDWLYAELADAWRAAEDEATLAYGHWLEKGDRVAFAIYRAAQDRADAAHDELAAHWTSASRAAA